MLVLWLLGCGVPSDFCEREAEWREGCGELVSNDELRNCRQSVRDCAEPDLAVLDDYAECLDEATCEPEAFFDCAAMLADLEDPRCGFAE